MQAQTSSPPHAPPSSLTITRRRSASSGAIMDGSRDAVTRPEAEGRMRRSKRNGRNGRAGIGIDMHRHRHWSPTLAVSPSITTKKTTTRLVFPHLDARACMRMHAHARRRQYCASPRFVCYSTNASHAGRASTTKHTHPNTHPLATLIACHFQPDPSRRPQSTPLFSNPDRPPLPIKNPRLCAPRPTARCKVVMKYILNPPPLRISSQPGTGTGTALPRLAHPPDVADPQKPRDKGGNKRAGNKGRSQASGTQTLAHETQIHTSPCRHTHTT